MDTLSESDTTTRRIIPSHPLPSTPPPPKHIIEHHCLCDQFSGIPAAAIIQTIYYNYYNVDVCCQLRFLICPLTTEGFSSPSFKCAVKQRVVPLGERKTSHSCPQLTYYGLQ